MAENKDDLPISQAAKINANLPAQNLYLWSQTYILGLKLRKFVVQFAKQKHKMYSFLAGRHKPTHLEDFEFLSVVEDIIVQDSERKKFILV